jgi:hypothetical protein
MGKSIIKIDSRKDMYEDYLKWLKDKKKKK